jgi:hypothetical protein
LPLEWIRDLGGSWHDWADARGVRGLDFNTTIKAVNERLSGVDASVDAYAGRLIFDRSDTPRDGDIYLPEPQRPPRRTLRSPTSELLLQNRSPLPSLAQLKTLNG